MADIAQQSSGATAPFAASREPLIGLYMRFCLRSQLAVCKDWTSDFDAYVTLSLGAADCITALIGRIKQQPYYSKDDPPQELASQRGIILEGQGDQYVIDFSAAPNRRMASHIGAAISF